MQDMDSETADALPGIHALTGFDYTAAFIVGKGKVRPFKCWDPFIYALRVWESNKYGFKQKAI